MTDIDFRTIPTYEQRGSGTAVPRDATYPYRWLHSRVDQNGLLNGYPADLIVWDAQWWQRIQPVRHQSDSLYRVEYSPIIGFSPFSQSEAARHSVRNDEFLTVSDERLFFYSDTRQYHAVFGPCINIYAIRPYQLHDHEVESAENEYFLQHGYSRAGRDSVHAAIQTVQSTLIKGSQTLTAQQRANYEQILCLANRLNEWECAVHEVTHRIKEFPTRPEFEHEALSVYESAAPIPGGFTGSTGYIAQLLEQTSPASIVAAHNLAWTSPSDQIKSHDARLTALPIYTHEEGANSGPVLPNFEFDFGTYEYESSVASDQSHVLLSATAATGATIAATLNGTAITSPNLLQSYELSAAGSENTLVFVVTAADGLTTRTYTVIINRAEETTS